MFCLTVLDQCPQCVWSKGLLTLFPLLPWVALTELLLLVLLPDEAEPFLCLREGPRLGVATRGGLGCLVGAHIGFFSPLSLSCWSRWAGWQRSQESVMKSGPWGARVTRSQGFEGDVSRPCVSSKARVHFCSVGLLSFPLFPSSIHKLRENVFQEHQTLKEKELETGPKASHGYGGKFGVEQDRMDKVRRGRCASVLGSHVVGREGAPTSLG